MDGRSYFVYVLRCSDGSHQVGYTRYLEGRITQLELATQHGEERQRIALVHLECTHLRAHARFRVAQLQEEYGSASPVLQAMAS